MSEESGKQDLAFVGVVIDCKYIGNTICLLYAYILTEISCVCVFFLLTRMTLNQSLCIVDNKFCLSIYLLLSFFTINIPFMRAIWIIPFTFSLHLTSLPCASSQLSTYLTRADGQTLNSFISHCNGGRCKNPATWRKEEEEKRQRGGGRGEAEGQTIPRGICPCPLDLTASVHTHAPCHRPATTRQLEGFSFSV